MVSANTIISDDVLWTRATSYVHSTNTLHTLILSVTGTNAGAVEAVDAVAVVALTPGAVHEMTTTETDANDAHRIHATITQSLHAEHLNDPDRAHVQHLDPTNPNVAKVDHHLLQKALLSQHNI